MTMTPMQARCPAARPSQQAGVALVELALVLPLLILLAVLVTEAGRAFYQYNTVAKSLRDAVRFLAVQDPTIATTDPAKITQARNMVVFGVPNPATGAQALVPELSLANVPEANIRWTWTATTPRYRIVSVQVTGYKFRPLIANVFGLRLADAQGVMAFGPIAAHMRAPE
jgi:hypothetical protein